MSVQPPDLVEVIEMKTSDLREFAAIPVVLVLLGLLFVVLLAADAGVWAWIVLGVALLAALVGGGLVLARRPSHPSAPTRPSLPEGAARAVGDGTRRVLVVADVACPPAALRDALTAGAGSGVPTEVFVVAPALGSRTSRWTGDDHAYRDAGAHLEATLAALGRLGLPSRGHVGSHDPLQAVEDGLREFAADEIVFAVHPAADANWLEEGVVEEARGRYPIPVRELVVQGS